MNHRVTVRLKYRTSDKGVTYFPWKWRGDCTCGWGCLSWEWSRPWLAAYDPAWEAEGQRMDGGALHMALDHIAQKQAELDAAIASIQTSIRNDSSVALGGSQ